MPCSGHLNLALTASDALSAFLRPPACFRHFPCPYRKKNAPDNFCAAAWLCTQVNGGRFRADIGIKGGFLVLKSSDNGERVRSLLCDREALARPSGMAWHGMAEFTTKQVVGFNVDNQHAVMNGIRKGTPAARRCIHR